MSFWLMLFVLLAFATLPLAAASRPNILWIVSEDNSPNLGCYGDRVAHTPNLDWLAAEGVRFTQATVPYSVCSPSRAAFLTGLYPQQNGQLGLATQKFAMYKQDTPNIVTLLKAAGYRTGIVGKLHVNPPAAFPYDFQPPSPKASPVRGANASHVKNAVEFWRESGDQPWFMSVNLPDAHLSRWFSKHPDDRPSHPRSLDDLRTLPWVGFDSRRLREVTATYYDGMDRVDEAVGSLLGELKKAGLAENTVVVYLSDHGAQFPRGKHTIYEGGHRIPLLIRWPGKIQPGLVRDELVSTVDLLPTMLKIAGVSGPADLLGWDLQPLFQPGAPKVWRDYTFGILAQGFMQQLVRDRRWKLIWSPRQNVSDKLGQSYLDETNLFFHVSGFVASERAALSPEMRAAVDRWESPPVYELYDLQSDPFELRNLAEDPAYAAVRQRLVTALQEMQRKMNDPFLGPDNVAAYAAEQEKHYGRWAERPAGSSSAILKIPLDFKWAYVENFRRWRERRTP